LHNGECTILIPYNNNNVRSLYRAGSLTAAARELARYKIGERCAQGVGGEARGKEVIGETQT
jgi:hypothetical protein